MVEVIESSSLDKPTEWGISFTCSNPEREDYFKMPNKETAFRLKKKLELNFECEFLLLDSQVKGAIKECEGKHVQQVAYSSYHDSLTQICFGCKKIRTSLKKDDVNVATGEGDGK